MMKPNRKPLFKTMVIVCEDSKVGPQYLEGFSKELKGMNIWKEIKIFPLPKSEEGTATNAVEHKSKRKIRKLIIAAEPVLPQIEPEYAAVPARYVREAQKRRIESLYDEAWAVYDKDGHPHHSQAYRLAQKNPNVNIAFTSIAIEQWFLLHFESGFTSYDKSIKIPLDKHLKDYVGEEKAKFEIYKALKPNLHTAIMNAAALRVLYKGVNVPFYERNPYTNIDQLLFRMHGYRVILPEDKYIIRNIEFKVYYDRDDLVVEVLNKSKTALVTNEIRFYVIGSDGKQEVISFEREIIHPREVFCFSFELAKYHQLYIDFADEITVIDNTCINKEPAIICA